ncbi:efflux RND transporter permease subunit [Gemmata palustris]|nr:efflux RND transporter permease subunit [Gemmata palustris]
MIQKLIGWAVANPLVVMILVTALAVTGGYAFAHVNIEAYPDPAPAIIEVVALYPGASAEEVERQVTVPLEVALAGMPGLETTRSKSLFGLAHVRNQFDYSRDYDQAKQDVLNRLASVNLPPGVTPQISPASPVGEILRFTIYNPKDAAGRPLYALSDLKAIEDYVVQRELLRVPRIAGVTGIGGTVKRYEVQPDPDRLRQYGVTLAQLQAALGAANANGSGDNLTQGNQRTVVVRSLGLIGQGQDPYLPTLAARDPARAAAHLRVEEARRCREIRQVAVAAVNTVPVRVDNLVDGGPVLNADGSVNPAKLFQKPDGTGEWDPAARWDDGPVLNTDGTPRDDDATTAMKLAWSKALTGRGVVVGNQTRQGRVGISRPLRAREWAALSDREQRHVRQQRNWPEPTSPSFGEELRSLFVGPAPEPGDPAQSVWWRDEHMRWQERPAGARSWAALSDAERAAVRAELGDRLPPSEPTGWRFYATAGRWDGWDDGRWSDEDDVVQGIVLLRKGQESLPALTDVLARIDELNQPGKLPAGMRISPFYNRTELINRTTETVNENLLIGMALVTAILLMFLGNVRASVIVAINIPLALLFAFGVLYARGKSANLLSIGAVDFGIIVDSSVIIVESIYRHLNSDEHADVPLAERISAACGAVTKSLFFATVVMVCALLPLFTMKGPEGQIFGPMADTYAFALAGALVLALTVSPVLCLLLLGNLDKPPGTGFWARATRTLSWALLLPVILAPLKFAFVPRHGDPENRLVRALNWVFLTQLRVILRLRWFALAVFAGGLCYTGVVSANMGREFMPELEEGNLMVRGTFPVNVSLEESGARARQLRELLHEFPEFAVVVPAIGRPDDGTDPTGYYNVETFCPLRPEPQWPAHPKYGRPRKKAELVGDLNAALAQRFPGVDWDISQIIRDNVMEALSGVKGENSIKVIGPELDALERIAGQIKDRLDSVPGVENPGVFRIQGQTSLEFPIDRSKCASWNVSAADVQAVIGSAVGGRAATQIQEGEKQADLTVRWPLRLRADETAIRSIPVPVGNTVTAGGAPGAPSSPFSGAATGTSPTGSAVAPPVSTGNPYNAAPVWTTTPTRRLDDLVTPINANGQPDPGGSFLRPGASTIYREQGQRLIAIKFEVRGRDLASTVSEARAAVEPLLKAPYRAEWSGEFKQMEAAEKRMARMFALSLALIALLLYLAFRSFLDAAVVFANVLAMGVGGVWALKLAGLNFNISAAVGFISILGVAVMNGLLFVSAFNGLRARGVDLNEALARGTRQLVRPVVMTALAAILGLLPAAFSTKMGSESQRPLAVVVVGGMLFTILTLVLVPMLYSFYGDRTPPKGAGDFSH